MMSARTSPKAAAAELTAVAQKKQHNEKRAFRTATARMIILILIVLRIFFYLPGKSTLQVVFI